MEKDFGILRSCPLFNGIADSDLSSMLKCLNAEVKIYKEKQAVMSEGERADKVGIVLSGSVQIIRVDYYGNRSIVSKVEPSEIFGESFACADIKEIPVNVVACENSRIMFIDCNRIINFCNNACDFHNKMVFNLLKVVATKNLIFHQKIEITSKRTTREKLLAFLMLQAKKNGSNSFTVPYDRQELADYLGVDRSGLSAEISKLRSEGIIESKRKQFKLLNKQ